MWIKLGNLSPFCALIASPARHGNGVVSPVFGAMMELFIIIVWLGLCVLVVPDVSAAGTLKRLILDKIVVIYTGLYRKCVWEFLNCIDYL